VNYQRSSAFVVGMCLLLLAPLAYATDPPPPPPDPTTQSANQQGSKYNIASALNTVASVPRQSSNNGQNGSTQRLSETNSNLINFWKFLEARFRNRD
jgi:hypothetical protein